MTQYVCTQLEVDPLSGLQTCTNFEVLNQSAFVLPSIPPAVAAQISFGILSVYATIWVFNVVRRTFF